MSDDKEQKNISGPEQDEEIIKEWKPEPFTNVGLGILGFGMTIGITKPPKKPDDEPLQ